MGRLTPEEYRRTFLTRQAASRDMLTGLSAPMTSTERCTPRSWPSQVSRTATIGALVGGGWLTGQALQASLIDALLPRL